MRASIARVENVSRWERVDNLDALLDALRYLSQAAQPAALILDLKQRGMLDDTLVVWGGGFGCNRLWPRPRSALLHGVIGRRRHPTGIAMGETDDYCYNVTKDPVRV